MTTPDTVGYASAVAHYLAGGWAGVLPLDRGTKYPPPTGYTGRAGAWPSDEDVARWSADNPGANVALRMPAIVVGIDVDHYDGKTGGDTLEALEQARGPLPPTWTSTSRGPGSPSGIRFYRVPDGTELPGVLGPSIEAIQRHHRYAVVAPSVVEGRPYRWYAPDGQRGGRPPRVDELAWLPDAWLDGWAKPSGERITLDALNTAPAPQVDRSRAVQRALDEGMRRMRETGGRHDAATQQALALIRLADGGHPGAKDALEDLGFVFRLAISDRSAPREAEAEWQRIVDGGWDVVRSTPSTRPTYDELMAERRAEPLRTIGQEPASAPQDDAQADPDREHGWECQGLAEIVSGEHKRPTPGLLRRST